MDLVLEEEKRALSDIKAKIERNLEESGIVLQERAAAKNSGKSVDYDDIQDRATANKRYKQADDRISEMLESRNVPYYARFDVENLQPDGDEPTRETYYITKNSIPSNLRGVVINWRAPMANCYQNKTETSFDVKGHRYDLYLRRHIEIANAQVEWYNTEFERAHGQKKDGLIVDPFLKKMLEKRRKEHQIADIIETIQSNQNVIIREDRNKNFIVQGCAGSGKTMVLLHRLSYLKYNHPEMFQSGVTIITPNEAFKQYIHTLSEQLELTTVEQKTMDEYYVTLIQRFSPNLNVKSTVANETDLPLAMRSALYSTRYAERLVAQYHAYWEDILYQLEPLGLVDLVQKLGETYPNEFNHTESTYHELKFVLSKISTTIKNHPTDVKLVRNTIKEKTEELKDCPRKIQIARDELSALEKEGQKGKKKKDAKDKLNDLIRAQQVTIPRAIEGQRDKLEVLLSQETSEYEQQNAKAANVLVKKLSMKAISKEVMIKNILELHEMYQHPYSQKNYRYKLYLELLFCSLYYATPSRYERFLNIDEAQDLTLCEYKLLKKIMGNRCTFNLYGDVKQLLHDYKGVQDWKVISDVLSANIYTLNENYRNSNQITNYCNDKFEYQIQAIGNDLSEITECTLIEAVTLCKEIKRAKPKYRVAVIIKAESETVSKMLRNALIDCNYSWLHVDFDKISIITVEQAKGVEFDAVAVLKHNMTKNERYVAYTRAISDLIVVNETFRVDKTCKNKPAV